MRKNYIYLDLGFFENCNLKCDYCRDRCITTQQSINLNHLVREIEQFKNHFSAGVVKLSGYGEITLWPYLEEALEFLTSQFPMVQIITNGTFSLKTADMLCKYNNININFTIDGNQPFMNSYRTNGNLLIHNKILSNLDYIIKNGKSVEVNSVLHNRNLTDYEVFLDYLMKYSNEGKFMLFPFPVKVFERLSQGDNVSSGDRFSFSQKIEYFWERYKEILPPTSYGTDLKDYMSGEEKKKCFVHWANLGSGGKDERLICPNYGESLTYGDFLKSFKDIKYIEKKENQYLYYDVGPDCSKCFNHFHIINLFLTNRISLKDMAGIPSLSHPETIKILNAVKNEFDNLMQL